MTALRFGGGPPSHTLSWAPQRVMPRRVAALLVGICLAVPVGSGAEAPHPMALVVEALREGDYASSGTLRRTEHDFEGVVLALDAAIALRGGDKRAQSYATKLVSWASEWRDPRLVRLIKERFARLDGQSQTHALWGLANLGTKPAARAFESAVVQHHANIKRINSHGFSQRPRHGETLFPGVLAAAETPRHRSNVYLLLLRYLNADAVAASDVQAAIAPLLGYTREAVLELADLPRSASRSWMWEEAYYYPRRFLAIALDCLRYFPDDDVDAVVAFAGEQLADDPRIQLFVINYRLSQGVAPDPERILFVASDDETRADLYRVTNTPEWRDLFPAEQRRQQQLAAAELADWLSYPSELGRIPDAVVLEHRETMKTRQGDAELFLFRWAAIDAEGATSWYAGMAGPYLVTDYPTTQGLGLTFSSFEAWDSMTPEDHVAAMREVLREWAAAGRAPSP